MNRQMRPTAQSPQDAAVLDVNPGDYSAIAQILAQRRNNPVYSVGQGIAQAGGDIVTALLEKQARKKEQGVERDKADALIKALMTAGQSGDTSQGPTMSPNMSGRAAVQQLAQVDPRLAVQNYGALQDAAKQAAPPKVQTFTGKLAPGEAYFAEGQKVAELPKPPETMSPYQAAQLKLAEARLAYEQRNSGQKPPANMMADPNAPAGSNVFIPIPNTPLDLQNKERERKANSAIAGDKAAVRGITQSADAAISAIDKLSQHPGLSSIVGAWDSRTPNVTEDANTAQSLLDNIKAKAFVETLNAMRTASATGSTGMGALSEKEGAVIQNAMAALNQASDEKTFREQLKIVRDTMQQSKNNVRLKFRDEYGTDYNPNDDKSIDGQQAPKPANDVEHILKKYGVQ